MTQIFHPSMNTVARVSIFGAVFFIAGAIALAGIIVRSPYATRQGVVEVQPIPFSHEHHVGEIGIDCRYCHTTVETQASAGMPSTEVCMNCHSQLFADAQMLAPVRDSLRSGKPIEWNRVHDLPDFVYFNHGIHVQKGIACASCHGDVARMPLMWRESSLHMEWCLDCHRQPQLHIRPKSEVFAVDWKPTGQPVDKEALLKSYHVSVKTDCSICHR